MRSLIEFPEKNRKVIMSGNAVELVDKETRRKIMMSFYPEDTIYMTKELEDGTVLAFNRSYVCLGELTELAFREFKEKKTAFQVWGKYPGGGGHPRAKEKGLAFWWEGDYATKQEG